MQVLAWLLVLAFVAGVLWWLIETRRVRRLDREEADAQAKSGGGGGPEPKR